MSSDEEIIVIHIIFTQILCLESMDQIDILLFVRGDPYMMKKIDQL